MGVNLPRPRPGDPVRPGPFNTFFRAIERLARRALGGRLASPAGSGIVALDEREFDALLSGTSSPYSWHQVRGTPGGGWADVPSGLAGTANLYEINATPNLGGKVSRVWRERGVYYTDFYRRGTSCHAGLRATVLGCPQLADDRPSGPLPGAAVTATKGAFSASGTTGADGTVTLDLSGGGSGTYTVTWSHSRYVAWQYGTLPPLVVASRSVSVPCFTAAVELWMGPAAGYACCANQGNRPCPGAYPTTLHLSDPDTSGVALAVGLYDPTDAHSPALSWSGQHNHTGPGYAPDGYGNCVPSPANVTGPVVYTLFCAGGSPATWKLRQSWPACFPGGAGAVPYEQQRIYFSSSMPGVSVPFWPYRDAYSTDCGTPLLASFVFGSDALIPGTVILSE